jgi:glutamine synthetase
VTEEQRKEIGVELLPANLLDATRELEKDEVLRTALGSTPREDYVDYFVATKQAEWEEWHNEVTPWEIKRYLQLF